MKKNAKENRQNRIGWIAVTACVCLVIGMTVFGGVYLAGRGKDAGQEENAPAAEGMSSLGIDTGAYINQRNLAAKTKTTTDAPGKYTLRIIEVIPHPACSIFPYLIDWGDKEDYDKNTSLGYDGINYLMLKKKSEPEYTANKGYMSFTLDGERPEFLTPASEYNYLTCWGRAEMGEAGWWRENGSLVEPANGYFEYVGEGKGLYHINLNKLVEERTENSNTYGIRYKTRAMDRKGSEGKKGEWEVKNARYYWAKDYGAGVNYPTSEVKEKTDNNYDLSFAVSAASGTYLYRADKIIARQQTETVSNNHYDYIAKMADLTAWKGKYQYAKGGNYQAVNPQLKTAAEIAAMGDDAKKKLFIRVENAAKDDGIKGVEKGYFLPASVEDYDSEKVYQVSFKEVGNHTGSYILDPNEVKSKYDSHSDSDFMANLIFEYAGEDTGWYDIAFLYAESSVYGEKRYAATLRQVSDGKGRYALTSTVTDKDDLYEKLGSGRGDYSQIIDRIDCAGADFFLADGGYYNQYMNWNAPGLCMGCGGEVPQWHDNSFEQGAWVFHTVSSDEQNGLTKIDELEEGLTFGKRIYVYRQKRYYRNYATTGFVNNEWFKLLMFLSNDEGTGPLAYEAYNSGGRDGKQIKELFASDLEEFNRTYNVEILQRTPGELQASEVEECDLLYFSEAITLPGLDGNLWNTIRTERKPGKTLPSWDTWSNYMAYDSDLSAEALMAIYRCCLYDDPDTEEYDPTAGLMFGSDTSDKGGLTSYITPSDHIEKNLGKMFLMTNLFTNPYYFSYFIDGYPQKDPNYSVINPDNMEITVYKQAGLDGVYNMGTTQLKINSSFTGDGEEIPPYTTGIWNKLYFRVVDLERFDYGGGAWGLLPILEGYGGDAKGYYGYDWGFNGYTSGFSGKDVDSDGITWFLPHNPRSLFSTLLDTRNIWKILHNKKPRLNSEPVVIVTNADAIRDGDVAHIITSYYYYLDDYSAFNLEDFDVTYKVNWKPENVKTPLGLVSLEMTREDGSVVESIASPEYKTEYTTNVSADFLVDGILDPTITERKYQITAVDEQGHQDFVNVYFIVRESFMLN